MALLVDKEDVGCFLISLCTYYILPEQKKNITRYVRDTVETQLSESSIIPMPGKKTKA